MFGINGAEALVLLVIALLVIGPERLPGYAEQLGRWARSVRDTAAGTRRQLSAELGEDLDWEKLDPRRYDPRRIVRDALLDDPQADGGAGTAGSVVPGRQVPLGDGEEAPFDDEAT